MSLEDLGRFFVSLSPPAPPPPPRSYPPFLTQDSFSSSSCLLPILFRPLFSQHCDGGGGGVGWGVGWGVGSGTKE